ncbi:MAG: hypothetical protein ACRD0G_06360 [Acidimicrobiales bacterium]
MGVPALFRRLFDDAALFPPGNAPMGEAVPAHRRHHREWYTDMVGPFLVPDTKLDELTASLSDEPLDVVLIVPGGVAGVASALDRVDAEPRLRLGGVEVPVTGPHDIRHLPEGVPVAVETTNPAVLDSLAGTGRRAKLRTGGVSAAAFPTEPEVAHFIRACLDRRVAFKCTAGLHGAARHTDPNTGFEHHGFLNVLLAVTAGLEGASEVELEHALAERDRMGLAAVAAHVDDDAATEVRNAFGSVGTCSVTEPIDELVALALVT